MTLAVTGECQAVHCGDWLEGEYAWGITDIASGDPDQVGHEECIKDVFLDELRRMSIEDLAKAEYPSIVRVTLTCEGCRRPKQQCGCP